MGECPEKLQREDTTEYLHENCTDEVRFRQWTEENRTNLTTRVMDAESSMQMAKFNFLIV
jgi:hypothetical protein